MELKDRLATLRRSRGYSLRELRERIEKQTGEKMAVSYLSSLERLGGSPTMEALTRIAAGYDMSVKDLLEPVEGYGSPSYPQTLVDFARDRDLDDDWIETLARIQYRGNRPDSPEEWEAIYGVLKLLSSQNTRSRF